MPASLSLILTSKNGIVSEESSTVNLILLCRIKQIEKFSTMIGIIKYSKNVINVI